MADVNPAVANYDRIVAHVDTMIGPLLNANKQLEDKVKVLEEVNRLNEIEKNKRQDEFTAAQNEQTEVHKKLLTEMKTLTLSSVEAMEAKCRSDPNYLETLKQSTQTLLRDCSNVTGFLAEEYFKTYPLHMEKFTTEYFKKDPQFLKNWLKSNPETAMEMYKVIEEIHPKAVMKYLEANGNSKESGKLTGWQLSLLITFIIGGALVGGAAGAALAYNGGLAMGAAIGCGAAGAITVGGAAGIVDAKCAGII